MVRHKSFWFLDTMRPTGPWFMNTIVLAVASDGLVPDQQMEMVPDGLT